MLTAFVYGFALAIMMAGSFVLARGAGLLAHSLSFLRNRSGAPIAAVSAALAAPVLVVCAQAHLNGSPELALGAATGASLFLLLPVYGFLLWAGAAAPRRQTWVFLVNAALAFCLLAQDSALSREECLVLLAVLAATLAGIRRCRACIPETPPGTIIQIYFNTDTKPCLWCAVAYIFTGFGLLLTSADIMTQAILRLMHLMQRTETVAGATLLGPTLAIPLFAQLAAMHRHHTFQSQAARLTLGMALLAGLAVPALCALLAPVPVTLHYQRSLLWYWPIAFITAALLSTAPAVRAPKLTGVLLIALYGAYAIYLIDFNR